MRLGRLGAAVLLAGTLAGCGSEGNPTAPSGTGPPLLVAFTSNRPPSPPTSKDIYFYDCRFGAPASRPPNLDSPFDEGPLALSADGVWLAYNTTNPLVGTFSTVVLYHIPTGVLHAPQTTARFNSTVNPSLSGDGRRLAFQSTIGSSIFEQEVILVDAFADTLVPTPRLHVLGALDFDPSLSGDGGLIAFTTNRGSGGFDIALYDVRADSMVTLPGINTTSSDIGVSISGDGRYLAFHSNRPGGTGLFDVYVYDRMTASFLALPGANTPLSDLNAALSPDGRWVCFTSEGEGGSNLRLYDLRDHVLVGVPGLNDPYFAERFPSVAMIR